MVAADHAVTHGHDAQMSPNLAPDGHAAIHPIHVTPFTFTRIQQWETATGKNKKKVQIK